MILFEWWNCVRNQVMTVGNLWNSGFEVEDDENSIWSLNLWNYSLVPKLWEHYNLTPNCIWDSGQCYYEVKDDKSQFDNWFWIFSVWSLNLGNLHFSPWTLWKLQFGLWFVLDRIKDGLWVKIQYSYVFSRLV